MLNIDPHLIGEWRSGNLRYVFDADGFFYKGMVAIPIAILDSGMKLKVNNITEYLRVAGTQNTGTIVGYWTTDPPEESIDFLPDGTRITYFTGEKFGFAATCSVVDSVMIELECRGRFETNGNNLTYHAFGMYPEMINYSVIDNTLTLIGPGALTILQRHP